MILQETMSTILQEKSETFSPQWKFAQLTWTLSEEEALFLAGFLDENCTSTAIFSMEEEREASSWCVEALLDLQDHTEAFYDMWIKRIFDFCQNEQLPSPHIEGIFEKNWLLECQRKLPPIHTGSFYVYQDFHQEEKPVAAYPLCIQAATAFGSGYHETTQACLFLLEHLWKEDPWHSALDLGCGSGILTLAMNSLSPGSTVGADYDEEAVRISEENARVNKISCKFFISIGFSHDAVRREFCVTVANILYDPLKDLVEDMTRFSKKYVILSGILSKQKKDLLGMYEEKGWKLVTEKEVGEWCGILLKKR